ncbi:polycystic kidney disease protein 1-like 3 [Antechinus flavipes]|uniref:polycystic kidney disease protein 1-like 3 n=1 Tax=Antechinus flavipes TaxID=38775 RepID=UPI0022364772|nr:polycystic kidney disease protein 1-like 3 [Antechinus flavipes]
MMFRTGIWLWLCIGQNVLRGGGLNYQKQHRKSDCYQLNRVHCSFEGAQNYCHRQGGQLMTMWNQDIKNHLKDYLEEGKKWWIRPDSDPLIKKKRKEEGMNLREEYNDFHFVCIEFEMFIGYPGKDVPEAVRDLVPKLQRACEILQKLIQFASPFSKTVQTNASSSLPNLSEQLLKVQSLSGNPFKLKAPPTFCPFDSFNSETEASGENEGIPQDILKVGVESLVTMSEWRFLSVCGDPGGYMFSLDFRTFLPWESLIQMEDMLQSSLLALGKIQETLLQDNQPSMIMTSSLATVMLKRQNISTLSSSSFTLHYPAPMHLGFPSASALDNLLRKNQSVNIQVTGLAFNPYEHFDKQNIVGSIGNVLLTSDHESLQIQDLLEEAEIIVWRDGSIETYPTTFNMSADHFVITINITSLEESLIVLVEPENPLSITLYLGFQYQPNITHFQLNITLPKEQLWDKDEMYSWVLSPENLQHGTGTYHITAMVNESKKEPKQTSLGFSVTTAATQCFFWDLHNKTWKSNGCRVGPQSTITKTQCLCSHLTSIGSFFMALPRTVNIQDTVMLFHRVAHNPVGVALLASLLGFYIIFIVWAWRKDREDRKKIKVTILADNSPSSQSYYLIQVFTGYRRKAATTAKVILILYGSEGRSDPHHLSDPHKVVFEQGAQDVFLLTTRSPLGELHSIRLWHDNSGTSPSWYVNQVIVSDLATKKKWYFLCNCWLAVDLGDCRQDQVFTSVSKKELLSFRHLFSSMIVEKFTQEHLWLSVVTCSPWNQVTRVQRLSCCMTILICNMVINIMFWKLNSMENRDMEDKGPFAVTWSELLISIQTSSILFPINLIIGRIFPLIQRQEKIPPHFIPIQAVSISDTTLVSVTTQKITEELKETVGFLHLKNACLPSEWEGSNWSSDSVPDLVKQLFSLIHSHLDRQGGRWQQTGPLFTNASSHPYVLSEIPENLHNLNHYLLRVLERLQSQCRTLLASPSTKPHDFLDSASQLQSLKELVETHILSKASGPCSEITSFPILDSEEEKPALSSYLPKWSLYICWLLLGVTSLVSAFFTALYSLKLNKDQATSWVISMVLSVLQNIFIIQPVKVTILTVFLSLLLTRISWHNKEKEQQMRKILALLGNSFISSLTFELRKVTQTQCSTHYGHLACFFCLCCFAFFFFFFWTARCPSLSSPGLRDENNPIYKVPAVTSPVIIPERTTKEKQLFQLAREIFVQILFLVMLMISAHSERNYNRFYLNQAIQKRINNPFEEIKRIKHFYQWTNKTLIPNLYGKYRGFIAEGNSLLIGSVQIRQIRIPDAVSFPKRISPSEQVKFYYQYQEDQKNYGVNWTPLDLNGTNQESIWCYQNEEILGGYPIQGQFAVYSGGGYVVTLGNNSKDANRILQHLKQNHWLDRHTRSLFVSFVVYNANVNLFCVVTLILESNGVGKSSFTPQVPRLKQQGWKYFTKKGNILDTSIIFITFIMLVLQVKGFFLHKRVMDQYRHNKSRFISFHEVIQVAFVLTYLLGFLVLLTTIRLWSLLRLNPRLQIISTTLRRAWDEVVGFSLIILILLTGYSIAFNILFGWSIADYKTFFNSAVTIVGLLMGIFDYHEVITLDPVLGSFLIITSVVLLVLVIVNLFVSAIMLTFSKERKSIMAQKEAPLTEILLQKLSNLLGIQRPQKAPEQRVPAAAGTNTETAENELT